MGHDPETQRWRVEAFAGKAKHPEHSFTCVGDRALDEKLKPLEAAGYRIKVTTA